MASAFSSPHNITLTDDSPTITYFPYRDGAVSGGWNQTCANSPDASWIPQSFCVGPSSHRSMYTGASILVEFEGTAAYLYGTAPSGSYVVQVDDQVNLYPSESSDPSSGLLAKSDGLAFGNHRLFLNVTQSSLVSFSEVVLTVGVGTGKSGSSNSRNRTIVPFTQTSGGSVLNSQFTYTGSWYSNIPGSIGATGHVIYPRQHTSETGDFVTFTVAQTSAFFVYGLVTYDLGPFAVTLTPPLDLGSPITRYYNSNTHWIGLDRVMYWASGMDRNKEYSVKITNLGEGNMPWWDFSHIDIIDAGSSPSGHHKVSVGLVAGAAAGGIIIILLLLVGVICYKKSKRTKLPLSKFDNTQAAEVPFHTHPPTTQNMPYNYVSTPYETMPFLPAPGFSSQQAPYNPLQQPLSYTGRPEVQAYQFNHPTPPPPAPSEFSSNMSYQTYDGQLALAWNGDETINRMNSASNRISVNQSHIGSANEKSVSPPQPWVVHEEDAGILSPPGDSNLVRLPPNYKDAWSQGYK